jgi:hypothetical protein
VYGTLKTWAEELGVADAAKLLDATLSEEKKTDALSSPRGPAFLRCHGRHCGGRGGLGALRLFLLHPVAGLELVSIIPRGAPVFRRAPFTLPAAFR